MDIPREYTKEGFLISTDGKRLQLDVIHRFLSESSYWAKGVPFEVVRKSIEHSLCFGVYESERQIGFGRVVTDLATFGYLADVFVLPEYRGRGLSKWLMECIMKHPGLQGLRRWMLATQDAHALYSRFGFVPLSQPERFMEIVKKDIYIRRGPAL